MKIKNKNFITEYSSEIQNLIDETVKSNYPKILNLYNFIKRTNKKKS